MKTPIRAAALMALVAVVACDEAGTEPQADDSVLNDDVALLAADAALEDLDVMSSMLPGGIFGSPGASTVLDFSRTRVVEYFDVDGLEQASYDALETASIHSLLELSGTITREGLEISLDRTRDMWVTGLEGEETERTWNGTGSDDRSRMRILDNDVTRTYDMSGTLLVTDVVRALPRSENPWPLSGSITRNVTIEIVNGPDGDRTVTRVVTITFNGTQFVTMMVNDVEYEIDLSQRGRDRVRRRSGDGG